VLTVTNGETSASVNLSGHFTSANFHITSGIGGKAQKFSIRQWPCNKQPSALLKHLVTLKK
jgi:hypothetical protein